MPIDFNKYPQQSRMRHHTGSNLYFRADELKEKVDYYPPLYDKINWSDVFQNIAKPSLLDVGCGKGAFLIEFAQNNPDQNILGIEVRKPIVEWLQLIIKSENIVNCGVIWYSIVNGLKFVESNSINKIFYLFPDPWHKRKHHKRRAFTTDLLDEFQRILTNDGCLYLATDVKKVDIEHQKTLNRHNGFDFRVVNEESEWNLPITNKEKFCRTNNIDFFRIIAKKRED